jgi:flagellar hook protein FlgE
MPFEIALSGINAAMADLNTTANNIANVNTTGFKRSRAEFANMFAVTPYGLAQNAIGAGVRVASVSQQFAQGDVNFTDNNLDMAISGTGFFTLSRAGQTIYSRAGQFGVDKDGFVVDPEGDKLQAFPPAASAIGTTATSFDTGRLGNLQLQTTDAAPSATTKITVGTNLPANATAPTTTPFDPTNASTYNQTTSVSSYDSLGVSHTTTFYYVQGGTPNSWNMYTTVDGTALSGPDSLVYDSSGALTTPAGGTLTLPAYTPTDGAAPMNISLDLSKSTQFSSGFAVNTLTQDGYTTGQLSGISVGSDGVVTANYTNGQSVALGQVALSNFANPQGLQQIGDNAWAETYTSGQPLRGTAGTSSFGQIQSGALEASNVDLTSQLVNMITAQRDFQANAQVISTSDQITQTIINIRN